MGKNIIRFAALMIFIISVAVFCMPGTASAGYSVQTGKVVNCNVSADVRSGPGTEYSLIGTAPKGALYSVTGSSGSWYAIDFAGKNGYINKTYLSVSSTTVTTAAYYASWSAYSGYTPDKIPADKVGVVMYAFAGISSGFKVTTGDSYIDPKNFAALTKLKAKYPNLKTVISVGGWDGSGRFSDAALTDARRKAFADSAVAFIRKYGFDGVDIDWEFPTGGGLSSNSARPQDKTNFTLLMAALRKALDSAGASDGKHYILSFAGASETFYINSVELGKLARYVDFAFLMAYDMHGSWDKYTDFNAPLYNPADTSPQGKWSCDAAVKLWVKNGFPKSMMVLGIPFYGNVYNRVKNANNGLYQTYSTCAQLSYDEIKKKYISNTSYKRYFHSTAMAPWLYGVSTFVSYEDARSAALKAQYAVQSGLLGAGAWELSQSADGTLIKAIYDSIK